MNVNENTALALACVIAEQVHRNCELIVQNDLLRKELDELRAAKNVPAETVHPDRILPPCLRWTKERPNASRAWRVDVDHCFTFFAKSIEPPHTDTHHGWLSFAENTP